MFFRPLQNIAMKSETNQSKPCFLCSKQKWNKSSLKYFFLIAKRSRKSLNTLYPL